MFLSTIKGKIYLMVCYFLHKKFISNKSFENQNISSIWLIHARKINRLEIIFIHIEQKLVIWISTLLKSEQTQWLRIIVGRAVDWKMFFTFQQVVLEMNFSSSRSLLIVKQNYRDSKRLRKTWPKFFAKIKILILILFDTQTTTVQ